VVSHLRRNPSIQPRLRYLLLEERRFAAEDLAPMRNLAAALFQLENKTGRLFVVRHFGAVRRCFLVKAGNLRD
jgi:hypothetical protein